MEYTVDGPIKTNSGLIPLADNLRTPMVMEDYNLDSVTFPQMDNPSPGVCRCTVNSSQSIHDAIMLDAKYLVNPDD